GESIGVVSGRGRTVAAGSCDSACEMDWMFAPALARVAAWPYVEDRAAGKSTKPEACLTPVRYRAGWNG
ncbi:MAG: hypothetical protein WA633_15235, partial [Stellaceae bacterium]